MENNTQIITEQKTPKTLADWLDNKDFQKRISDCLSQTIPTKQFVAVSLNSANRIPKLKQASIPSLLSCLTKCAELQLLPDGIHAHLIPFENKKKKTVEAQFILGYKGMVDLIYRKCNIVVTAIDVRENDVITCKNGEWEHVIKTPSKKNRGEVIGYIGFAKFPDGRFKSDFIDMDELYSIRAASAGYKYAESTGSKDSVWHTKEDEMGKKTIIRRLFKTLPLTIDLNSVIRDDDEKDFPQYSQPVIPRANPFELTDSEANTSTTEVNE